MSWQRGFVRPVLTLVFAAALPSCDDGGDSATCSVGDGAVYHDETTGLYLVNHPETGRRWLRCPIGQEWSEDSCACEGETSLLYFAEAIGECPPGFVFPSDDDFATVLCNYSEAMIEECPAEHFDACAECSLCDLIFPEDVGYYPSSDYQFDVETGTGAVRGYDFGTGCSSEDYYDDNLYGPCWNVRCVEEAAP